MKQTQVGVNVGKHIESGTRETHSEPFQVASAQQVPNKNVIRDRATQQSVLKGCIVAEGPDAHHTKAIQGCQGME